MNMLEIYFVEVRNLYKDDFLRDYVGLHNFLTMNYSDELIYA